MTTDLAPDLIATWRTNYGLDRRTPEEAMRWWSDNNIGQAPAGAVAALGLCLEAIDAWHRVGSSLLHGRDTPTVRTMVIRGFLRGYLAGWRAAKREGK